MYRLLPRWFWIAFAGLPVVMAALPAGGPDQADAQGAAKYTLIAPIVSREEPLPDVYVTREGDTLAIVATLYGTTLATLERINDLPPYDELPPGTRVFAPKPPPPPPVLPCEDVLAPLDKAHAVPAECTPAGLQRLPLALQHGGDQFLDPRAADALVDLAAAASNQGHSLRVRSSYRSYAEQVRTFQFWVDKLGYEEARRVSAEPGHSEHQLGTAADVTTAEVGYELTEAFGDTAAGRWLAANASRYGFIISYPEDGEAITGYAYEPWHIRWVGTRAAEEVQERGVTLHEYLLDEWLPGRYLFDFE